MSIFSILLGIHILSGGTALLSGTINVLRHKGDRIHKRVGKVFLWSMLSGAFSSLALAYLHPNYFLFVVGIFTIYMVCTGQRSLSLKKISKGKSAKAVDWLLTGTMILFALLFAGMGIYRLLHHDTFGIVLLVFGSIALLMVRVDVNHYRGNSKFKNAWLPIHIQRMVGAYISSATAFLVVNVHSSTIPGFVFWLLPTAVLVPFIVRWSKYYGLLKDKPQAL